MSGKSVYVCLILYTFSLQHLVPAAVVAGIASKDECLLFSDVRSRMQWAVVTQAK